jgi:AcrR family transcriptional regulator
MPVTSTARARPRGSAAARSRAATRERLVESGKQLFAERSLHGVTSHDIAQRAGLAAGTFYLHFKDKRALFGEIVAQTIRALRERLDAAADGHPELPARVRARARAMVEFAAENRDVMRMLFGADAEAASVEADVLNELADSIAESRRRGREAGRFPAELDPAVLAQALVGMWARVVAWWTEDPSRAQPETIVETLTRIQLSGTHPA